MAAGQPHPQDEHAGATERLEAPAGPGGAAGAVPAGQCKPNCDSNWPVYCTVTSWRAKPMGKPIMGNEWTGELHVADLLALALQA